MKIPTKIILPWLVLIILILVFLGYIYFYQKPSCDVSVDEIATRVSGVEEYISSYFSTTKELKDLSTQGGEQTNFSENGNLKLIQQTFYGETGKSEVAYFFLDGKIYYIHKLNTEYQSSVYEDPHPKIKSTILKEFYLGKNQNLCSWYQNKVLQENNGDIKDFVQFLIQTLKI